MNPQLAKTANLNLPPPMPELSPSMGEPSAVNVDPGIEQHVASPEHVAQPTQTMTSLPMQATLPAAPPAPQATHSTNTSSTMTTPSKADDNDLIEKEWVNKAKEIIAKTLEDPYGQSKQISVVKADYMKKRYNKDIKLVEE